MYNGHNRPLFCMVIVQFSIAYFHWNAVLWKLQSTKTFRSSLVMNRKISWSFVLGCLSVRTVSYQLLLERQLLHGFLFAMVAIAQCDWVAIRSCTTVSEILYSSYHFKTEYFCSTDLKKKKIKKNPWLASFLCLSFSRPACQL